MVVPYQAEIYEGPRQSLPQPFALNGAFYAISRATFSGEGKFLPEGTLGYEMPPAHSHNLDSAQDLLILQAMLAAGHWNMEFLACLPKTGGR